MKSEGRRTVTPQPTMIQYAGPFVFILDSHKLLYYFIHDVASCRRGETFFFIFDGAKGFFPPSCLL